jgi:CelD/BcsL family acetyltransferase involved in cellulose biosynthesis
VPVTFETIVSEDRLVALGDRWNELVRAMPRPSPFLLHCWVVEWWRHYGQGSRLAVEVAFRGRELVGALPLITFRHRGLRIGTFVGARQSALADALIAEGEDQGLVEALADRAIASEHDYVDLFGLSAEGRLASLNGPRRLELFQRIEAPVLDLSDGWETVYRRKTDSRKRAHHKRRRRQLAELGRVEVVNARTLDELEPALEEAFRIHELRWRGRPDGSGFVTETGKRFTRAVMPGLAEIDAARIVVLKIDGRAVAFSWNLLLERHVFLHRLAFDPAYSRCSPGITNALASLELAAGEGAVKGGVPRRRRAVQARAGRRVRAAAPRARASGKPEGACGRRGRSRGCARGVAGRARRSRGRPTTARRRPSPRHAPARCAAPERRAPRRGLAWAEGSRESAHRCPRP